MGEKERSKIGQYIQIYLPTKQERKIFIVSTLLISVTCHKTVWIFINFFFH